MNNNEKIKDLAKNLLANISGASVTNNVTDQTPPISGTPNWEVYDANGLKTGSDVMLAFEGEKSDLLLAQQIVI